MFKVKNEAESVKVYIYGTIGSDWWDEESSNTAKDFSKTLDELSPKDVELHIDSGGGDVYEGFAIASAIERYEGKVAVYVDGLAASAASYIAAMGDTVTMNDYAFIMIHNASTFEYGNKNDFRTMAERLDGIDNSIALILANRSGQTVEDVKSAMDAETWYTGAEALEAGLCDEVIETSQRLAACLDAEVAKDYMHIPEAVNIAQTIEDVDPEPAEPDPEPTDESHEDSTIKETTVAKAAIVLGNRIYRKDETNEKL
jgi:ATP-dependent protease ClpP protease subunit